MIHTCNMNCITNNTPTVYNYTLLLYFFLDKSSSFTSWGIDELSDLLDCKSIQVPIPKDLIQGFVIP